MKDRYYFAYGSNMNLGQMKYRMPTSGRNASRNVVLLKTMCRLLCSIVEKWGRRTCPILMHACPRYLTPASLPI